jgi:hypothetical protein
VTKVYTCYLHKAGALAPELRVVMAPSEDALADVILAQMETWGQVEKIDVYDDADRPLLTIATSEVIVN